MNKNTLHHAIILMCVFNKINTYVKYLSLALSINIIIYNCEHDSRVTST